MTRQNPTMVDVANAAGVSIATVSRALNGGKIAAVTQRKVERAIARLGYRRNTLARGLVTGKSGVIGVLIPDVVGPLYAQMARGIEDVVSPVGMHFMMATDSRDLAQEAAAIELLLERRVDGMIIIGSRLEHKLLKALLGRVPVVFVQREIACDDGFVISLDNHAGTAAALGYLMAQGHRRIAHVAGVRRDGEERRKSFCKLLEEAGLKSLVIQEDGTEEGGCRAGRQLAQHPEISAVFCSNDRNALGLYYALKSDGRGVPEDVSVIGFDDLPYVAYLDPPLTTVRQPGREMGRAAARQVLSALEGKASAGELRIPAELVIRASVKRHEAASARKEVGTAQTQPP